MPRTYPQCPHCGEAHKVCTPTEVEKIGVDYIVDPTSKQLLTIVGTLIGLNEVIGKARAHWSKGAQQKKEIEKRICEEIMVSQLKPIKGTFTLDILWVEKDDKRDPDNIIAAKKFILDALQTKGIIVNDNMKYWKGLKESWQVATPGLKPGVYITLIEE